VPELPETETIARDLAAVVSGRTISALQVPRGDVLRGASAETLPALLRGARVVGVRRRAKSIVLDLTGAPVARADAATPGAAAHLVVTPRFTGALLLGDAPDDAYTCLTLSLDDGTVLRYRDVRRLGTVAWQDAAAHAAWDAALGPEPLDPALTPAAFADILRGSRRAVKTILMDQRRLAGIGNIYATEALWEAGLRPSRPGARVTRAEGARVFAALRRMLPEAIALRGTTFRDYQDARGGRGGYAARLQVYGRAGQPCPRCGAALQSTHALEGRRTVHCPDCQR
jgi:formamidopyrimidine-DNA glycosylase